MCLSLDFSPSLLFMDHLFLSSFLQQCTEVSIKILGRRPHLLCPVLQGAAPKLCPLPASTPTSPSECFPVSGKCYIMLKCCMFAIIIKQQEMHNHVKCCMLKQDIEDNRREAQYHNDLMQFYTIALPHMQHVKLSIVNLDCPRSAQLRPFLPYLYGA